MTTYLPVHGGFIRQCSEFVDQAFGSTIGINYWFAVMIIPAEITAAVSVLQFWPPTDAIPLAAYITISVTVMALANGIARGFVQVAFSFGGGEHIAVIAGEVASPRSTIRKTVRPVFWRMFTFFVANIWLVGMCVAYDVSDLINESGTLGSPLVIALKRADVWGLAHAINGFIFLSVISCGVTSVYVASQSLTALADLAHVHGSLGKKDAAGRPWSRSPTGSIVYGWFSSLVATATLFQWASIYIAHLRFRTGLRAQGRNLADIPFKGLLRPYPQCFSLLTVLSIFAASSTSPASRLGRRGPPRASSRLGFKTRIVKPSEMNFSAAVVFDEMEQADRIAALEEKAKHGK
ncbi:amino acid permease-domain-containing protein [Aspergillus nidulans var. acristatus]